MNRPNARQPIVLRPGEGRGYPMPTMRAVFKADGDETANRYCVSEWWLEPESGGPGAHSHDANDEIFYVIEGTPSVLVGDDWIDAPAGSCIVIPAGVTHDFANRTRGPRRPVQRLHPRRLREEHAGDREGGSRRTPRNNRWQRSHSACGQRSSAVWPASVST